MVVPVGQQTRQQIRATQKRAVSSRRTAHGDVIAPTRAGMTPVEQEFLSRQASVASGLIEERGSIDNFAEGSRRMDVDLDHAGVRGDLQGAQARVGRWRIPLKNNLPIQLSRCPLNRRQQREVVFQVRQRRHENIEVGVAHFHAKRCAQQARDRLKPTRGPRSRVCGPRSDSGTNPR